MNKIKQHGMSLIELSVVLFILVALAGMAVPYLGGYGTQAACTVTDTTMQNIKQAIMGGGASAGYYMDLLGQFPHDKGSDPKDYNLNYLFVAGDGNGTDWAAYNPKTNVGWRGAYLQNGMTLTAGTPYSAANLSDTFKDAATNQHVNANLADGDTVALDGWGRPIILQVKANGDARLVSAGAGSGMALGDADIDTTLTSGRANDDRVLYLNLATPAGEVNPTCD